MGDKFISIDELKTELSEINNLGESLNRSLSLVSQKIKYLVLKIKSCECLDDAIKYFDLLDKIHFSLATLVFKEEIGIPDKLRQFVSDFDNLEAYKSSLFLDIKNGKYLF